MKAIKYYFDAKHIGNPKELVELPSDLMVAPYRGNDSFEDPSMARICHSESANKWYILYTHDKPFEGFDDVYDHIVDEGTFSYCMKYMVIDFSNVPFKWGVPLQSYDKKNVQYIPIWLSVPSGRFNEEGFEYSKLVFKLITCIAPICEPVPDDTYGYNLLTAFTESVYEDTHEGIRELIKDIECKTFDTPHLFCYHSIITYWR